MKLDARLEAVRAFVPAGGTVADIGTDHGYLAAALVLQPMNGAYELRHYLYTHSWHVADEALVVADDRIYTVIRAEKGRRKMPDALTLEIGPVLWERKPELSRHHIESLLFGARRAVAGMEKSERAKKSAKYKEAQKRIKALEERLVW